MDPPRRMHRFCRQYRNFHDRLHGWFCENSVSRCIASVYCDDREPGERQRPLKHEVALCFSRIILNILGSVLSVFLLWLVFFRPYKVRPYVDAAMLAAFSSSSGDAAAGLGPALRYDLALNVTFFNDHNIYSVRFDHLTASLHYDGIKIGASDDTLPSFNLGPRRRRTVYPALRSRAGDVGAAVVEELARQRAQGRLSIDVRVKTTLTYMFWPARATYYYEYDCSLLFPARRRPAVTDSIKCHVTK